MTEHPLRSAAISGKISPVILEDSVWKFLKANLDIC